MAEDLQSLLEKINREGVEKADAKAAEIVKAAQAKADEIIKNARAESEELIRKAEKTSADYATRAAETIRQAARDIVLDIEESVTKRLNGLLAEDVDSALGDPTRVGALIGEALKGLVGSAEIAIPPKLASALKAQLAAQGNITVVTDETLSTGFSVRIDGGRVEHSFTGDVIAAELAKRLRSDLSRLVSGK